MACGTAGVGGCCTDFRTAGPGCSGGADRVFATDATSGADDGAGTLATGLVRTTGGAGVLRGCAGMPFVTSASTGGSAEPGGVTQPVGQKGGDVAGVTLRGTV